MSEKKVEKFFEEKKEEAKVEPKKTEVKTVSIGVAEFCDLKGIRKLIKGVAINKYAPDVLHTEEEWKTILQEDKVIDFSDSIYFIK